MFNISYMAGVVTTLEEQTGNYSRVTTSFGRK